MGKKNSPRSTLCLTAAAAAAAAAAAKSLSRVQLCVTP